MKILNCQLMKNLKFNYDENENNIKYEELIFNGIPIPKNIKINDISSNSLNICWEIDDYIDNNKARYIVELRKEKENFNKVYEGNKKNCLLNNLSEDTNYEFRICTFYNDSYGLYTEVQKIKTKEFNSTILKDSKRKKEFIQKILDWSGYNKMELIYRGSEDGSTSKNFHDKCDNKGPNIVLFKNEKGNIFGGYCPISWKKEGDWQLVPESFIFTLTNIYNIEPTKFNRGDNQWGIYFGSSYGPWFGDGSNIGFSEYYLESNNCYSSFGENVSYKDTLGKGKSLFTGDQNNNNCYYKLMEIECFKLSK